MSSPREELIDAWARYCSAYAYDPQAFVGRVDYPGFSEFGVMDASLAKSVRERMDQTKTAWDAEDRADTEALLATCLHAEHKRLFSQSVRAKNIVIRVETDGHEFVSKFVTRRELKVLKQKFADKFNGGQAA